MFYEEMKREAYTHTGRKDEEGLLLWAIAHLESFVDMLYFITSLYKDENIKYHKDLLLILNDINIELDIYIESNPYKDLFDIAWDHHKKNNDHCMDKLRSWLSAFIFMSDLSHYHGLIKGETDE